MNGAPGGWGWLEEYGDPSPAALDEGFGFGVRVFFLVWDGCFGEMAFGVAAAGGD